MSNAHASTSAADASASMVATDGGLKRTIRKLVPYLWPQGRGDLRFRVVLALSAMVIGRVITVIVPYFYKLTVDALTPTLGESQADIAAAVIAVPLMALIAYGISRVLMSAFQQLQTAIFVPVSQNAQRSIAVSTFRHLHRLSLRFHLDRRTGGLSRIIDRGTGSIAFFLRIVLFNLVPAIIELALVGFILTKVSSFSHSVSPPKTPTTSAVTNGTIGTLPVSASDTTSTKAVEIIRAAVAVINPPAA